ncbi:MAG: restriction endonuclease [Candidatus Nitrosopolaris sp.]
MAADEEADEVVGKSGDEGIDGLIKEDILGLDVIYIQAKKWDGVVGRPVEMWSSLSSWVIRCSQSSKCSEGAATVAAVFTSYSSMTVTVIEGYGRGQYGYR